MKEEKKQEETTRDEKPSPEKKEEAFREIIIKTDGNKIQIVKSEVSGQLEFKAILQEILKLLN